jgi:hypothetical protein
MSAEDILMRAWLQHMKLEQMRKYLQAGRCHKALPTEALKERWIKAIKQWSRDVRSDPPVRVEIECELSIRHEELPIRAVLGELETIKKAAQEARGDFRADPSRLQKLRDKMHCDLVELQRVGRSIN